MQARLLRLGAPVVHGLEEQRARGPLGREEPFVAPSYSPDPFAWVPQKRVGELIERSESCFEFQAADIDGATLAQVVPVLQGLESLG